MCMTTYLFIHDQISPGIERETIACTETNLSFKISLMYRHICRILWSVSSQKPRTQVSKIFLKCSPPPWFIHIWRLMLNLWSFLQSVAYRIWWCCLHESQEIRKWGDHVAWSGLSGKSWERRQNCPASDQWQQNRDMRSWSNQSTWCLASVPSCPVQGELSEFPRRWVFTESEPVHKQQTTKQRDNYKKAQMIVL